LLCIFILLQFCLCNRRNNVYCFFVYLKGDIAPYCDSFYLIGEKAIKGYYYPQRGSAPFQQIVTTSCEVALEG
jgi:hypothetical protein